MEMCKWCKIIFSKPQEVLYCVLLIMCDKDFCETEHDIYWIADSGLERIEDCAVA